MTKVCVTSSGNGLDAEVDPRFGRASNFFIVYTDTLDYEVISNPNVDAAGGAGIQSGQLIASKGAKAVLTGNVGPNAFQTLQAAGLDIYTGVTGTIRDAVEKFNDGSLKPTDGSSVGAKFGTGGSR